jgi:hypothetical protein
MYIFKYIYLIEVSWMRPYFITAKLMRPSNMKRFPTPVLGLSSGLFLSGITTKILYAFLASPMRAIFLAFFFLFIYCNYAWRST